jgi:threonine aldolase
VVAIENTHNSAGGRIFPLEEAQAISAVCRDNGVAVHLDGARIFNAQAATGIPAARWADQADTVTFCFSKGLGAPIGSMVVGDADVVSEARRLRKRLGGGMRQVGVIAAAARVALDTGVERLSEDHANATRLAEGLADLHPDAVDPRDVETNMVYVDVGVFGFTGRQFARRVAEEGIVLLGDDSGLMRMVTHRDVTADDIEHVLAVFKSVLQR